MTPPDKLRIGDWCVDPNAGRMSRGARSVRVEARTMRLLLDLAEHAGQAVSIDDLLDRVWAGVIVTPDSVYQAVASLRRLLGDDPRSPRYIATVPRLGYRMVAPVAPWTAAPAPRSRPAPRAAWLVALALALLMLGGASFFFVRAARAPSSATSIGVQPFLDLTQGMGEEVLVDDLTERVADRLSQTPGLKTTSARTVFALKGKRFTPAQAAHALGVGYVVDGSVHGEAPRFRVTVRLTEGASGFVVWSRVYERDLAGVATLQDAIAPDVVAALHAPAAK